MTDAGFEGADRADADNGRLDILVTRGTLHDRGRIGEPRGIAPTAGILSSDVVSYTPGAIRPVDGGISV